MAPGTIHILPQTLINKIAAGEVIVRPASVVKELVENSTDARPRRIAVEISNSCRNIKVTDDGSGMEREDAEIAFQRHSTSKIATYDDINRLTTRGFRGEALASIAAVSSVEMLTRTSQSLTATRIRIVGGAIEAVEQAAAPVGTIVDVRDLFFNTPARLKFLKSPTTELHNIVQVVVRQAFAAPTIAFSFTNDSRKMIELPPDQALRDRIVQLLGTDLRDALLELKCRDLPVHVSGFIASPAVSRKDRRQQYFFVNGRPITSRALSYAFEEAFKGYLMTQRYPVGALFLDIDPAELDINVHPTKEEVRFRKERAVTSIVHRVVLDTLRMSQLIPRFAPPAQEPIEDHASPTPSRPAPSEPALSADGETPSAAPSFFVSPQGFLQHQFERKSPFVEPFASQGEAIGAKTPPVEHQPRLEAPPPSARPAEPIEPSEIWRSDIVPNPIGQIASTYIVAEFGDDLLVIDQHAAHERILYLRAREQAKKPHVQPLLVPITLELGAADDAYMELLMPRLAELGIETEHFGGRSYVVRTLPADFADLDITAVIKDLLDDLHSLARTTELEVIRDRIVTRIACHAAIKSGQALHRDEMKRLIEEIRASRLAFTCPHGRPTMILITRDQLDRQFKRK
jgi:DNA mismatch repair protein MutL